MTCKKCGCYAQLYPIDPIGRKGRRWWCSRCISELKYPNYYLKRGQKYTVLWSIRVFYNKYAIAVISFIKRLFHKEEEYYE